MTANIGIVHDLRAGNPNLRDGTCPRGCPEPHDRLYRCIVAGHLMVYEDVASGDVRFQHGPNPEHSVTYTGFDWYGPTPPPCRLAMVDAWVTAVHRA